MILLKNIIKDYLTNKETFRALNNINISFADKGFVAILGPSGCGKTTLLNIIGGLDKPTNGEIVINNKSSKDFIDSDWDNYRNKRIGFVFQHFNLIPNLTILENIVMPLKLSGIDSKTAINKALEALKKVGLEDLAKKKANVISGGQAQRVAIARAIINNPDIILADEPTGALDSVSSEQVLDVLKEVSKDHLVIMVTHAKEYATKYASRIIELKDGVVTKDSNNKRIINNKKNKEGSFKKKSKMPILSIIKTSWKSFMNKKKRSIAITLATSIGIFGVALVLALTNGLNNYITDVETYAATVVPITVTPFVSNSSIIGGEKYEKWPSSKHIIPYDDSTSTASLHHNNITKEYSEYASKLVDKGLAASVLENHEGLDFNILTQRGLDGTGDVFKVNQYTDAGDIGTISSSLTNVPATIFHELYGGADYINSLYDVIAGRYPTNKNEVVLACDRFNRVPISTLRSLGIINQDATSNINFSDIVDKKSYKVYAPDEIYTSTNSGGAPYEYEITHDKFWKLEGNTFEDLKNLVAASEGETKTLHFFDNKTDINAIHGQEELNSFYKDPSTGLELKVVGVIRLKPTTQVSLIPGSICYTKELKDYYVDLVKQGKYDKYREAARNNWFIPRSTDEVIDRTKWGQIVEQIKSAVITADRGALSSILNSSVFSFYDIFTDLNSETPKKPKKFDATTGYKSFLKNNLRFSTEFRQDMKIVQEGETYHLENFDDLMDVAAYLSGYSTITSVLIFPNNLQVKPAIREYLNEYNKDRKELDQIKYADLADSLTSSVSTLISVTTIGLICFSAIALLISSILTGVIAYTSVVERTKEIGILRAIGARKRDVSRLFELETMFIGLFAGIIGIIIVLIIQYPISNFASSLFPADIGQICNLNPIAALILLVISIALSFLSGLIPALIAAKKDPVEAFRDN